MTCRHILLPSSEDLSTVAARGIASHMLLRDHLDSNKETDNSAHAYLKSQKRPLRTRRVPWSTCILPNPAATPLLSLLQNLQNFRGKFEKDEFIAPRLQCLHLACRIFRKWDRLFTDTARYTKTNGRWTKKASEELQVWHLKPCGHMSCDCNARTTWL